MQEVPRSDANALVKLINSTTLLNKQLSAICQLNGLTSSGVKAHLQNRIVNLIQETVNCNDLARFRQIESSVDTTRANGHHFRSSPAKPATEQSSSSNMAPNHNRHHHNYFHATSHSSSSHGATHNGGHRGGASQTIISFKSSPFYEIRGGIGSVRTCEAMNQHRNMVPMSIKANDYPILNGCATDKSLRVMVFCAGDRHGVQDISFPHQSEVKVNGGEVKANLRGLKNKPGSTRPVDITHLLRLRPPNYDNRVELVYALTQKVFHVGLYFCKVTSVQELADKIRGGRRIPKASVIQEITKAAADTDIVTTSQVLSLKCPLSYMRLALPCRSHLCTHIQCFDATSYLQLQEQGPQWLCPICNKSATFETLAVDEFVKDILARTSPDVDQVTIQPDGQWRTGSAQHERSAAVASNNTTIDGDDDLEISEVSFVGGRQLQTPTRSAQSTATPTTTGISREGSSLPRGAGSVSAKRPAPEVVDLTLSSDDDDGPPPPKKPHLALPGRSAPHYYY